MAKNDFGSIRKLPSGMWAATYMHDGGRHTPGRSFPNKNMASAWLNEQHRLIQLGVWVNPKLQKQRAEKKAQSEQLALGMWMDRWLESQRTGLKPSTFQSYQRTINNRITGVDGAPGKLKNLPLVHVDRQAVFEWWDGVQEVFPTTEQTNYRAYGYLRSAMGAALERELITANPVQIKKASKRPKPKSKELPTRYELQAIVDHTPRHYKLAAVLCYFHGMRIGEVLGLKRDDLRRNPQTGMWQVHVSRNMQRLQDDDGHSYMAELSTKTEAGNRTVPIFEVFSRYVDTHLEEVYQGGKYLTMTKRGNVLMDTNLRNELDKARRAAGVDKHVTPHRGRDFLITMLAEQGATPKEIGSILGQTDLKTITETYMQVREDNRAMVLQRAGNFLGGVSAEVVDLDARRGTEKRA